VFALRDVEKKFSASGTEFCLRVPALDIARGAKVAFIGESGSGKSTLLELLAMILTPTASRVFRFAPERERPAHDVDELWDAHDTDELGNLRSRHIGYVLQYGGLLPYLSVRANIELPRRLLEMPIERTAARLAAELGIEAQLDKLPATLSVGQRQRAAIARALAHEPAIVIADEPTAAVDPMNAERIVALLVALTEARGVTLIVATHAHDLARRAGFAVLVHRVVTADDRSMTVQVSNEPA
jgi:putative ABC transport system ATP-binding protein